MAVPHAEREAQRVTGDRGARRDAAGDLKSAAAGDDQTPGHADHRRERQRDDVQLPGPEGPGRHVGAGGDADERYSAGRRPGDRAGPGTGIASSKRVIADLVGAMTGVGIGREDDAVAQHPDGQVLEVLRHHEVPAAQHRKRFGGAQEGDPGARAGAEVDVPRGARGREQFDDVAAQRRVHLDSQESPSASRAPLLSW